MLKIALVFGLLLVATAANAEWRKTATSTRDNLTIEIDAASIEKVANDIASATVRLVPSERGPMGPSPFEVIKVELSMEFSCTSPQYRIVQTLEYAFDGMLGNHTDKLAPFATLNPTGFFSTVRDVACGKTIALQQH